MAPGLSAKDWIAAVAAARKTYLAVFERAGRCARVKCRRQGFCRAGWYHPIRGNPLYHPTGTCPVMSEAEWKIVQLGIVRQQDLLRAHVRALDEREAAAGVPQGQTGEAEWRPPGNPPMGFAMILFSEPTDTGYQWPKEYDLGWREWYEKQMKKAMRRKRG